MDRTVEHLFILTIITLMILSMFTFMVQASYEDYYRQRYRPLRMGTKIDITYPNGTYRSYCSFSFPAYQDYYTQPDRHFRDYGIVTASHCGDVGDKVYQNDSGVSEDYIGYFKIDGRFDDNLEIRDPTLVDAAFVRVETVYCSSNCPAPSIVSTYIQHASWFLTLDSKINDYSDLYDIYTEGYTVYKGGVATGLTSGKIVAVMGFIYRNDPFFGPIFYADYDGTHGDSGGIVYTRIYYDMVIIDKVLGTVVGGTMDPGTGRIVAVAAPVYIAEDDLSVQVYTG